MFQIGKNPMQSPGAYAIVNAIKNNPESTLIDIELTVRLGKHKEDSVLTFLYLFQVLLCCYWISGHHS